MGLAEWAELQPPHMAITKSLDGGSSTSTIEYEPSVVYANVATDKQPAISADNSNPGDTDYTIGSRYSDPTSHDGEDIVIERTIRSLEIVADGDANATTQTGRTTSGGRGTGLTVDVTAAGGVVTAVAVNDPGDKGYQVGDLITITNSSADVDPTFRITLVS